MAKALEGVRLHPQRRNWDDISDYVAHFTKDAPLQGDETQAAHQLVSILRTGTIEARTRWGAGRAFGESPMSVCFTETPVHQLKRVAAKRSQFGLGFSKDFIVRRGGGPVFYAYRDQGDAIASMVQHAVGDVTHPIWRVAPFVDQPRENYSFEWEREWRVPAHLEFHPNQLRFITAPEEEHDDMLAYFKLQEQETGFPAYACPIIDLKWTADRVGSVLR